MYLIIHFFYLIYVSVTLIDWILVHVYHYGVDLCKARSKTMSLHIINVEKQ